MKAFLKSFTKQEWQFALLFTALSIATGAFVKMDAQAQLVQESHAQEKGGGRLTGEVRGLDEEAKIVHAIENARTFKFREFVAFAYATAELKTNDNKFYSNPENVAGMNSAIVTELRRAMLCEDAPAWVKEQLLATRWWNPTNGDNHHPGHWHEKESPHAGIDWSKVPENCIP